MLRALAKKLSELKETIDLRRTQGLDAALAVVNSDRGKAEMDAIRAQLAAMSQEEAELRSKRLAEMNDAQKTALVSSLLSGALGILLTATIGFLIRRATLARRREDWLQSGQVGLASAMIGDQRIEQLGNSILEFLARYLGAVAGALAAGAVAVSGPPVLGTGTTTGGGVRTNCCAVPHVDTQLSCLSELV